MSKVVQGVGSDQAAATDSLCQSLNQALKDSRSQRRACSLTAHAFDLILSSQQLPSQQLMITVAAFFSKVVPTDWKPDLCQMLCSAVQALLESEPAEWQTPVLQQLLQPMKLAQFVMKPDRGSELVSVLSSGAVRTSRGAIIHEVTYCGHVVCLTCSVLLTSGDLFSAVTATLFFMSTSCSTVASCLTAMYLCIWTGHSSACCAGLRSHRCSIQSLEQGRRHPPCGQRF